MRSPVAVTADLTSRLLLDRVPKIYLQNDARFLAINLAPGIYSVPHLPPPLPGETR